MKNKEHLAKITFINQNAYGKEVKNGVYKIMIEIPDFKIKIKLPMCSQKVIDEVIESTLDYFE